MIEIQGKLVKPGRVIMVQVEGRRGPANLPIPGDAKFFRDSDFTEGCEVTVERDETDNHRIKKVFIPGKPLAQQDVGDDRSRNTRNQRGRRTNARGNAQGRNHNPAANARQGGPRAAVAGGLQGKSKAAPNIVGKPFHNPYTFLRFAEAPAAPPMDPTLLSVDELSNDSEERFTGIIRLKVTTETPLKSCHPDPISVTSSGHQKLAALTVGNDVIVPSTGVRGSLRTLMTILTNGTLGYIDPTAYLVQGRDLNLGPRNHHSSPSVPSDVFLAEVVQVGSPHHSGIIRVGDTRLVKLTDLQTHLSPTQLDRSPNAEPVWIGFTGDQISDTAKSGDSATPWRLRLSGEPIGTNIEERKREALFKPGKSDSDEIQLPADYWEAFIGRNASSEDCPELRKGHLVWLQVSQSFLDSGRVRPQSAEDIESLQWARLGRVGQKIEDKIPPVFHPDSWKTNGKVDEVTNLFGQVSDKRSKPDKGSKEMAITFAARIRPDNLVFPDAKPHCQPTPLAPLAMPHPGCLAFYRDKTDPDKVGPRDGLRGYKVYRTSRRTGADAPWHYSVQPVYNRGDAMPPEQKVNQTVDLMPAGQTGDLNLAVRSLTKRELALLIQACQVPWRLGGGKPLGLGLCKVEIAGVIDEMGNAADVDSLLGPDWKESLVDDVQPQVIQWTASQQPVDLMRYPRAAKGNARGGHTWFGIHARPRMTAGEEPKDGLTPIHIIDPLKARARQQGHDLDPQVPMISGQCLPFFDPNDPDADVLYGYDLRPQYGAGEQKDSVKEFQQPE